MILVRGLQRIDQTEGFIHVPPRGQWIIDHGSQLLVWVYHEDGSNCLGLALTGHDHAVLARHIFIEVGDHWKGDLDPRLLLDVPDPGYVAAHTVNTQPDQFRVPLLELGLYPGKGHELCGADGCEVRRMGEKDQPASLEVLQPEWPMRSDRLEPWSRFS